MITVREEASYQPRKARLLRNLDRWVARVRPLLLSRYGEERTAALIRDSRQEYEALVPQIPYIGDRNPLLIFLLPTSRHLAVYRALQRQGEPVEAAGRLIYEMSEAELRATWNGSAFVRDSESAAIMQQVNTSKNLE